MANRFRRAARRAAAPARHPCAEVEDEPELAQALQASCHSAHAERLQQAELEQALARSRRDSELEEQQLAQATELSQAAWYNGELDEVALVIALAESASGGSAGAAATPAAGRMHRRLVEASQHRTMAACLASSSAPAPCSHPLPGPLGASCREAGATIAPSSATGLVEPKLGLVDAGVKDKEKRAFRGVNGHMEPSAAPAAPSAERGEACAVRCRPSMPGPSSDEADEAFMPALPASLAMAGEERAAEREPETEAESTPSLAAAAMPQVLEPGSTGYEENEAFAATWRELEAQEPGDRGNESSEELAMASATPPAGAEERCAAEPELEVVMAAAALGAGAGAEAREAPVMALNTDGAEHHYIAGDDEPETEDRGKSIGATCDVPVGPLDGLEQWWRLQGDLSPAWQWLEKAKEEDADEEADWLDVGDSVVAVDI